MLANLIIAIIAQRPNLVNSGMENPKNDSEKTSFGKFSTKEILFFIISSILFIVQAYFWKTLITNKISTQPIDYVLPILATIGFAVIFVLTATLATAPRLGWLFLPAVSFVAIIFIPLSLGSYIAAILIALTLIYAFYGTRSAYGNSIKFNTSTVIKSGLSGTFTAVAFLMSFYYLHVQFTKPVNIIPTGLIEGVVSFSSGIFGQQVQNQLPIMAATPEPGGESGGFSLQNLPPGLKNLIPSNILDIFGGAENPQAKVQSESDSSPVKKSAEKTLTQQITNIIQTQIDKFIEPYKPFIPYVFTILFFFSVRSLLFILTWFITPLAAIVLKFLILLGIIHKETVQIEAERIFF